MERSILPMANSRSVADRILRSGRTEPTSCIGFLACRATLLELVKRTTLGQILAAQKPSARPCVNCLRQAHREQLLRSSQYLPWESRNECNA
jgi:hypothetical protein